MTGPHGFIPITHQAASVSDDRRRAERERAEASYRERWGIEPEPVPAPKPVKLRVVQESKPPTPPAPAVSPAAPISAVSQRRGGRPIDPSQVPRRAPGTPIQATASEMARVASSLGRKVGDEDLDVIQYLLSRKKDQS